MGSTFAQGLAWGEGQAAAQDAHRQALSDAELETNIGQANDNIAALQTKLSTLDPSSRDHAQTMLALQQQIQDRTALFHPANNPGAFQKFGHLLRMGRQAPPPTPVAPPTISTTPSMQMSSPGAPGATPALPAGTVDRNVAPRFRLQPTPAVPSAPIPALGENTLNLPESPATTVRGPQTPAQLKAQAQANMIGAGVPAPPPGQLTPEEEQEAARIKAGLAPKAVAPKPTVPVNPKNVVWLKHPDNTQSPYQFLNGKFVPVEGAEGLTPPAKEPAPSNSAFAVVLRSMFPDVKDGHYTADQVQQAMTSKKQWETPDTNSTRDAITYDAAGNATVNELHTSSHRTFGGKGGGSSSGGAKGGAPGASAGRPLPGAHRNTPAQNKANTEVVEATKLSSMAQQVMQHPDDAVNQKRLAVALERVSAGRFTTQALDYIIKAGWGNTIEQWVNNPTTGALPADIVRQLVDGANQNLQAAKDAQTESYKGASSTPGEMKDKANPGGGQSLADRLNKALDGK